MGMLMDINIKYLSQLKTISALKVLIAFLTKQEKDGTNEVQYVMEDIKADTKLSLNSIRTALKELSILELVETLPRKGNDKNIYKIKLGVEPEVVVPMVAPVVPEPVLEGGYMRATAARKKKEDFQHIKEIDFNVDLFHEDINSLSIFNVNVLMTEEERGKLARRIILEIHKPRVNRPIGDVGQFISRQLVLLRGDEKRKVKGLLETYRTEQIIAAIIYWTEIENAPNGLLSLSFLKARSRKDKQDNIMVALDHFKAEYNEHIAPILALEEAESRIAEQLKREEEAKAKAEEERKVVENMSSEEFVSGYMNRFQGIANKFKKKGDS
jgi:hypothetical protein